jgi:hypothetical protein
MSVWKDSKGVPIRENDLLKIYHFLESNGKKVWLYKRVITIEGEVCLVANDEMGIFPLSSWSKAPIEAIGKKYFKVVDGDWFKHPLEEQRIFFNHRKKAKGVPDSYYIART